MRKGYLFYALSACVWLTLCAGCTDYLKQGHRYYEVGEYRRAVACYSKAVDRNPKSSAAFYTRGVCYRTIGEHDRAIADLTRAIELNPINAVAYRRRGTCHADKDDHDRAIDDFTRAIAVSPRFAGAHYSRGVSSDRKRNSFRPSVGAITSTSRSRPKRTSRRSIPLRWYCPATKGLPGSCR